METLGHTFTDSARVDGGSIWHFRAIPEDVQRCTVRRLALCGLPDYEIAARTGWAVDRVRQVMHENAQSLEQPFRRSRPS